MKLSVQKGYGSIGAGSLCLLDDKSVIHILQPYPWEVDGSVYGLDLKFFAEQVGHNGTVQEAHGCTMYLLKILILEEEICDFRQNSSNIVM